jgi:type VI secretion system protein ImpH
MAFAAREIDEFNYVFNKDDSVVDINVYINFFCLQSVNSPLALNFHESIVQDVSSDLHELNDFFNFFNNRAVELLSQTYTKKSVLNTSSTTQNIWSSLLGFASHVHKDDKDIYHRMMSHGDLVFGNMKSSVNIAKIIEIFFNFDKVTIEDFIPRIVRLSESNMTKLNDRNTSLSDNFIMGNKTIDSQNKCRIHIHLNDETEFLPNGKYNDLMNQIIQFLLPLHLLYDIKLYPKERIKTILGNTNLYLGWTIMLANENSNEQQVINLKGQ